MEETNLYSKINFINPQYDQNENLSPFSSDIINDSFYSSFMNNIFSSIDNLDSDKNFILYDFENKLDKEKETINNNLNENKINTINKEEIKRQLRLKRKRESAKEGRLRKKIYFENLINQINELQIQNSILLKVISKCPHCEEEYSKELETEKIDDKNNNYILSDKKTTPKKAKFLFMTAIALISIFNIFNIFYFNKGPSKINFKANLAVNQQSEILINKLKSSNENEALLIHFQEYYTLTTREKLDCSNSLKEEINRNIKIYNNNKFNISKIDQTNAKNCVKCMMEVDKNSIRMGGDEFTFYLVDRLLSKNFMNNLEDGIFPELDFEKENKKSETFSKVFALRCKIVGYSINNVYSEKIGATAYNNQ